MMLAYIEGNIISKKLILNLVLDFNLKATLLIRLINAASFSYKSLIFKESSDECLVWGGIGYIGSLVTLLSELLIYS